MPLTGLHCENEVETEQNSQSIGQRIRRVTRSARNKRLQQFGCNAVPENDEYGRGRYKSRKSHTETKDSQRYHTERTGMLKQIIQLCQPADRCLPNQSERVRRQ